MGSDHPDGEDTLAGMSGPRRAHPGEAWGAVLDDMEATAEALREEGWETMELHPGDVTIVEDTREPGIDILVPGDEFDDLRARIEAGVSFEDYEVYRAETEGMVYAVIVAKDDDSGTSALMPVYLDGQKLESILDPEPDSEGMPVYLRRLDGEMYELRLQEPSLLLDTD